MPSSVPEQWHDKRPSGRRLARFAVIADTHVNQAEDQASSFFPLNRLANARSRQVAAMLEQVGAEFVLHLGDIVHPVPGKVGYGAAAQCFRDLYARVPVPIYLTPGNHDIGDKAAKSAPAASITSEFVDIYRKTFGEPWLSFDHGRLHFVIVNAPLINSGLPEEEDHRRWLEADLAAHSGRRTFMAIHYPPYVWRPDEPASYDNIDEPGRSWLLGLLKSHRVEAVFCGHVHNFWYDQHAGSEIYIAPSTAFVRQDYSEFMRVRPPGAEGGRADVDKLGFFVVDVHEGGHVAMWLRSHGEQRPSVASAPVSLAPFEVHTKLAAIGNLGVDLRHPWAEVVELPPSGALEEFERKRARNDYPLCAVWDMGLRLLRVPVHDLLDADVRRRMYIAHSVGNRFVVSLLGLPDAEVARLIVEHAELLDSLEVTLPISEMAQAFAPLAELRARLGRPIFLSKLRRHEDAKVDGLRYGHLVFFGWVVEEWPQIEKVAREATAAQAIDGLVFRAGRRIRPSELAAAMAPRLKALGLQVSLCVRLAGDDPAGEELDDEANASRVGDAVTTALGFPDVRCVLDTFMDVDRGYFRRNGLLDRAYNLRPAGALLRTAGAEAHAVSLTRKA